MLYAVRVLTLVFVAVGLAVTVAVWLNGFTSDDERIYFLNRKWSIAGSDYPLEILHWQTVNTTDFGIGEVGIWGIVLLPTGICTWPYWWRGISRRRHLARRRILNYAPALALALCAHFTWSYWPLGSRAAYSWLVAGLLLRAAILVIWPPKYQQQPTP
jgi:hypothetical protein